MQDIFELKEQPITETPLLVFERVTATHNMAAPCLRHRLGADPALLRDSIMKP